MVKKLQYIELFAGCGGMSLGLESAGFDLIFANELSPMAGETFAYNILHEDLRSEKKPRSTLWLNSNFETGNIARLTEYPNLDGIKKYCDIDENTDLFGKLLIGDIRKLLTLIKQHPSLIRHFIGNIDLVSGGPPCQSFSLAGRREKNNKRNKLPWLFAEFVSILKPRIVLLENVSGILRAFKDVDKKYYAWFEVAKAFGLIGYVPICMHINAKYFGLPQNRPRFILMAIRKDLITEHLENDHVIKVATNFINKLEIYGETLSINQIPEYRFFDLNNKSDVPYFYSSFVLPTPIIESEKDCRSVFDAIDNIKIHTGNLFANSYIKNDYDNLLDEYFGNFNLRKNIEIKNHNVRNHTEKIKTRFKLLKEIQKFENGTKNLLHEALRLGSVKNLPTGVKANLLEVLKLSTISELENYFLEYKSRKHSQKALYYNLPAPATLSIPDDVCHYDPDQNRTLTIREMARIQSFPDWFEFRSKDTTGGTNRRFEVPNYTQVGNAVPPLLGKVLGEWLKNVINQLG